MQIAISSIRFYGWCVGLSATMVRRTRPKHGSSLGASITDHLKCSRFSVRLWVVCTWIITRNQTNETCTFHHHSERTAPPPTPQLQRSFFRIQAENEPCKVCRIRWRSLQNRCKSHGISPRRAMAAAPARSPDLAARPRGVRDAWVAFSAQISPWKVGG